MSGETGPAFVPVTPPLDVQVAVYPVINAPLFAPGVNDTISGPVVVAVEPDIAFTFAGAAGDPTTTASDGMDGRPVPRLLAALTLHA